MFRCCCRLNEKVPFQEFDCEEEANKKKELCVVRDSGGREIGDVVRIRVCRSDFLPSDATDCQSLCIWQEISNDFEKWDFVKTKSYAEG